MKQYLLACSILLLAAPAHALYEPAPEPAIAATEGEWTGSLRYRDYQHPDRFETLPTRTAIALSAPDTLTLHSVYDDGPNKTVHSYESMRFDLGAKRLDWRYGLKEDDVGRFAIIADTQDGDCHRFTAESERDNQRALHRYEIALCATRLEWTKFEVDAQGVALERSRTQLARVSTAPISPTP